MSKRITKLIWRCILIVAAMMIWGYSISQSQYLQKHYTSVSVRFQGDGITQKMIDKLLENELEKGSPLPEITAWNRKLDTEILSKAEEKRVKVSLYEVFGDTAMLYPMELVDGTLLLPGDPYGCVIDEDTAYFMFGTKYAVGQEIMLEDKTYTIRGVVKQNEAKILIQSRDSEHKYRNLEIVYDDVENAVDLTASLLVQNNIYESYSVLEGGFYSKVSSYLILIPGWILLFFMIKEFIYDVIVMMKQKLYVKKGTKRLDLGRIIYFGICLVGLISLIFIVKFKLYIPDRLIPSRWSNLEFWSSRIEELKGFLNRANYIEPFPKDVLLLQTLKYCVTAVFLSCTSMLVLVAHKRILLKSFFSWIIPVSWVAVFSIIIFGINYTFGSVFAMPSYYPGIVIAYLIYIFYNQRLSKNLITS